MFLKVCSFDIEVLTTENRMPFPDKDCVLLVSCHFNYDYEAEGVMTRNVVLLLHKAKDGVEKQENRIVYIFNNEPRLLSKLFNILKENDIFTGYNVNNFDFVYIADRAKTLGMKNINIGLGDKGLYCRKHISKGFSVTNIGGLTGKILIDVLGVLRREDATNVFLKKYNLKNLKLENVSREILGVEKLEFSIQEMNDYWNDCNNIELRNRFVDYCSRDSELALMFLTKFRLLDKFFALSKASGKLVQDVINSQGSGSMVENLLLKEFRKYDRVMPIRTGGGSDDEEELEGAFVLEPVLGVTDNIGVCDYASLYPSIMIKHNLSYDTLILESPEKLGLNEDDIVTQLDEMDNPYARFVKKEKVKGIIPRKLEELLVLRKSQKKEMNKYDKGTSNYLLFDSAQNATKILLNSFYGYTGDSGSKVYSWFIATAVTTNGRKQIRKTIDMVKNTLVEKDGIKYKLDVVASDTDSTYVHVMKDGSKDISREEVVYCVNYAADKVNETLEKPMNLAFESYIKRIIIIAKKHYAYLSVDDKGKESITSKGLETVRRDWCSFSTDNMTKIIDFILKEKDVKEGVNKSIELLKEQAKLLKKDKIDLNLLVLSKKLTDYITAYDGKAVHVQVAIKMKDRGHASEVGDRIQYLITDNGKKLVSDRAEEAEYVMRNLDKFKIDKTYYIYQQLLPPAQRVLRLLGVKDELLLSKMDEGQKSLFDY